MVTILKALALIPIGYALGWGVYWGLGSGGSKYSGATNESPIGGLIALVIILVMFINLLIKFIDDYPAWLYIISIIIGMIIYGVKKFIKEFYYLWRNPRE